MLTTLIIAAFLAAPPAPWADPFAPAGPLCLADFVDPPQPKAKPAPYLATAEGLEWWALDQDWGETVSQVAPMVNILATKRERWIINSAILCYVVQTLNVNDHSDERARRRLVSVGMTATDRLYRDRVKEPLSCDKWPVERLTKCIGLLPGPECSSESDLALQVMTALRLMESPL
jgi:hypothetical protein